jgi:hypothetical protein
VSIPAGGSRVAGCRHDTAAWLEKRNRQREEANMRRLIGSVLAVLIFLPSPPAPAAGLMSTLGINFLRNIKETQDDFAKAGIREMDFQKDMALESAVKQLTEQMVKTLEPDLQDDSLIFRTLASFELPRPQCLYYENAIEAREDIALVAVCFYGKEERQVLVMPYFRKGKTDVATLRQYLTGEYGQPNKPAKDEVDAAATSKWLWVKRPWFHAGLIPKKYVFLLDAAQWSPKLPGISALIAYVDAWKLYDLKTDIQDEQKAAKAGARKGL